MRGGKSSRCLPFPDSSMDSAANSLICPATADMAGQACVNFIIAYGRLTAYQSLRLHDHAGLTVAALRHVLFRPCFLARMVAIRRKTFYSCVLLVRGGRNLNLAGANWFTIFMNCAGAAHSHTAAVFGSGEAQKVAQYPEQWHVRISAYHMPCSIDGEAEVRHGKAN